MDRRQYLIASCSVGTAVLGGCLGQFEGNTSEQIPGFNTEAFENSDIAVDEVYREDSRDTNRVVVRYATTATTEDEAREEIVPVALAIADAMSDPEAFGAGVDTISVTAIDEDGQEMLQYELPVGTVTEYADGDISEDEFRRRLRQQVDELRTTTAASLRASGPVDGP